MIKFSWTCFMIFYLSNEIILSVNQFNHLLKNFLWEWTCHLMRMRMNRESVQLLCSVENDICFVFLFSSCFLLIIQMNMRVIPSESFDEPCEEDDSRFRTFIQSNPFFVIPYWTTILVLITLTIRGIIHRSVCALHFISSIKVIFISFIDGSPWFRTNCLLYVGYYNVICFLNNNWYLDNAYKIPLGTYIRMNDDFILILWHQSLNFISTMHNND